MTAMNYLIISLAIGFTEQLFFESTTCGVIETAKEDFRCFFKQISFTKDLLLLDLTDSVDIEKFKTSCDTLKACYSSLECRKNDPQYVELSRNTNTICSAILFLGTDFVDCKKKIDEVKGDCDTVGNTCDTVFGKDQCLKPLIVDSCGEEKWFRFRENIINLKKPSLPDCDFDQYRN
uniref:DUF19 domain-containing protein n=1 Tax=Caenorhabditis tropicalis TaxID=1561998 RepID=A0A1I7V2B0_9PELO